MSNSLNGQLDTQVDQALDRASGRYGEYGAPPGPPPGDMDDDGDHGVHFGRGDAVGTLNARFGAFGGNGEVITDSNEPRPLSTTAMNMLDDVSADGEVHVVDLPGVGSYRVKSISAGDGSVKLVAGQSTHQVDEAVSNVVFAEVLLGLGAVGVAVVAGRFLVRRQLRPLREVAATAHEVSTLPLASGEIGTTVRVAEGLTDERTEVGQVGSALNTMLAHVEHALDARHRSETQIRQFVADASHELRTPLTTIHGYAQLSRRQDYDAEQLSTAMAKVDAEATRMSSLVEDMLLLARLDSGRPLARDEVDLTRLVLETVGDARVVGPDHHWTLDLPDEPLVVAGDEQRLHQVVTNLTNNARRHTPPGTTVTVGAHPEGDQVVLTVTDDGPGMTPDLVRTAFERFTRGDSSRTRESGGAGLGLSLVQAISAAHAGTVSVQSQPGRTRFEVRLPGFATA
ncbi:MAG: HAMP domain-containing histidine kinase [Nocardioidaceae bacterium]|nr:HAMP domain-containing histidine kinase [Nocardioidaceae bacterium]NUS51966.1 HAMP domain-containing histidine kinase [Nocardioidaceae bacterium]